MASHGPRHRASRRVAGEIATHRPRSSARGALALLVSVLVVLSGCAPQSPDHSSWTDQARQGVDDVASEVATVTLLLRLEQEGKVPGKYQQVVAQDSETAVGEVMSKFGGEQPEPRDDGAYKHVTSLMSDASDLLSQVRIAIVRRDEAAYPDLLRQLEKLHGDLSDASSTLTTPEAGGVPQMGGSTPDIPTARAVGR